MRSDKNKEGLGYSAVPPPIAQIYSSPKKDLSWTADCTEVKTNKVEAIKKSSVKYAEMYIRTTKKPNVRGNQRNWNNLKSHQLGPDFAMKKNACFNYGDFNHLAYDCRKRMKKGTSRS
nr:ubiquitin hydrolase [Tanacetum cinerariifolium]